MSATVIRAKRSTFTWKGILFHRIEWWTAKGYSTVSTPSKIEATDLMIHMGPNVEIVD